MPLAASAVYLVASCWMLFFALKDSWATIAWVAVAIAVALGCFFATRHRVRRPVPNAPAPAPVEDVDG